MDQVDFTSVLVDLGTLAATVSQASEALAAAAVALAEAAQAISDASLVADNYHLSKDSLDVAPHTDIPKKPDSSKETEVGEDPQSQADQHGTHTPIMLKPYVFTWGLKVHRDLRITSQSEPNNLVVSPSLSIISISSESSNEEEPATLVSHPNEPLAAPQLLQHDTGDDLVELHATPGPELNNKRNITRLLETMKSHPTIPPGQNYIYLDRPSEVLAFIAYMALQANIIICVLPDHHLGTYPEMLKSLTNAKMHRIDTPEQLKYVSAKLTTTNASHNIFFTPCNKFVRNAARLFYALSPDCVLHSGQPSSVYYQKILSPLSPTVKSCLMIIRGEYFNASVYGAERYPDAVVNTCFAPNSPFQLLRQVSSQLLLEASSPTPFEREVSEPRPKVLRPEPTNIASKIPQSREQKVAPGPLPIGHYYIMLDQESDVDIIPIITCIALKSKKVICHIPGDKSLAGYQKLIKSIAEVNVLIPTSMKGKKLKAITNTLKTEKSGILLRPVAKDWSSFLSKSLVDSLVHCGAPADVTAYATECKLKVERSYLILTKSQYSSIQSKLSGQGIKKHPQIRVSDNTRAGTLQFDLQQGVIAQLS
ncbi:hypothetical protein V565_130140 [Rhizoctonia solani 123E]|uniref:Uncharacterized protein n=1 Tax=Rhizoctonia solani 123E TaxID=1423351 RepID=A0A074SE13_9AGAM|nr:hypothetical protein V565_130140 [Rhizoctonia solani 123E]